jgi:chorismate synthase
MSLRLLTAGESHGPELVVVVDGLPAGLSIDRESMDRDLARRQGGYGRGARSSRIERDRANVVSGVAAGHTTGAPVAVRIENRDHANQPASARPIRVPRPGHADLVGGLKYGLWDLRDVRERASARETAARVAAGALARQLLEHVGASVVSFVLSIGSCEATPELGRDFRPGWLGSLGRDQLASIAAAAEDDPVRCPAPAASAEMCRLIDDARARGDTVGGVFCVAALGVPPGLGSYVQWDRRLDGLLAQAVCSIQGVKGVQIGPAFDVARMDGSRVQDPITLAGGDLQRSSNFAGGLEGGVTNGEPVVLVAAMKPLSSTRAPAESVHLDGGAASDPPYVRSDVCSVPAAAVVGEAMVAWVLADALLERFGSDRLDVIDEALASIPPLVVSPSARVPSGPR